MPTVEQIEETILVFVRDRFNPRVVATATPEQMGFDSLAGIKLALALEIELDIEIPDEWIDEEKILKVSFHDIAVGLHAKLNEN